MRQTVADLMQLVRVIEVGIDADGDGVPDLNPSRIFYFGLSLGTNYGAPFLAVEPAVRAGDLTSIVGPFIENRITILLMAPPETKTSPLKKSFTEEGITSGGRLIKSA